MTAALATLEAETAKLRNQLTSFPAELLSFRPGPDSWSSLQVLEHLIRVEQSYVEAVRENLLHPGIVTWKDRLGALAVQIAMRLPTRVKTPGPVAAAITPQETGDLPTLVDQWAKTRLETRSLLKNLTPAQSNAGLFRHPVAGWMAAKSGVEFLSAHLRHHQFQLNRLKSAYGSRMQTSRRLR